jgi:hypothetical protein
MERAGDCEDKNEEAGQDCPSYDEAPCPPSAARLIMACRENKLRGPAVLRNDCVCTVAARRDFVTLLIGYSADADD